MFAAADLDVHSRCSDPSYYCSCCVLHERVFRVATEIWNIKSAQCKWLRSTGSRAFTNLAQTRSLQEGLTASDGRDIVGFVSNGMQGDVLELIDALSATVKDAGKSPKLFESTQELSQNCVTNGVSDSPKCFGAIVFLSSPEQGTDQSPKGTWNYTIRGDPSGGFTDVTKDQNNAEIYTIPLQRAVDAEILARSRPTQARTLSQMKTLVYTSESQEILDSSRTSNFLGLCVLAFGVLYTFTFIGIVYHMTSFVAYEREPGMSGLIDAMVPGGNKARGRILRQIATYVSFAMVYLPSWIAVGVVVSVLASYLAMCSQGKMLLPGITSFSPRHRPPIHIAPSMTRLTIYSRV